jgi:ribA/ribD-fused uncharacterized protein
LPGQHPVAGAYLAERVLRAGHPKQAEDFGRQVRGFDEIIWDAIHFETVVAGSVAKFGQHEGLKRHLLGTGERVLVEASPVDRIWGPARLSRN